MFSFFFCLQTILPYLNNQPVKEHQIHYALKINPWITSTAVLGSLLKFSSYVAWLCLQLHSETLKPLHAAQDGFVFIGLVVFITCAKPCKRQFRCDRNAVSYNSHLFTAEMHNPSEYWNIAPWAHVGSVSLNFKVTTSAWTDQWNLAGSKEQTEEFLSHKMKTHWHLQVP